MKVTVLIENTPVEGLQCEHGLSLYITCGKGKYLLDAGSSGAFLENAKRLGIRPDDVDACILSHGHYDHGGGFEAYLKVYPESRVYAMENAREACFSTSGGALHEISVPGQVWTYGRQLLFVREVTQIGKEVYLIPHSTPGLGQVGKRAGLYRKKNGELLPDDFSHELSLVFDTEAGLVVFNSCSHSGVSPILAEVKAALPGRKLLAFVGGLHMKGKRDGQEICMFSEDEVEKLADALRREGLRWLYTGHCTGEAGYELLQSFLGDRVQRLVTGRTFCLPDS